MITKGNPYCSKHHSCPKDVQDDRWQVGGKAVHAAKSCAGISPRMAFHRFRDVFVISDYMGVYRPSMTCSYIHPGWELNTFLITLPDLDEKEFYELAAAWKHQTGHFSTMFHKANNINYLRIIGMGQRAIPLLLKDLKEGPEHWFVALSAITKVNPIAPEDMDDMHKMSEAWIRWGEENHWI